MAPIIKRALRVAYCMLLLSHDQMSCDPFAAILLLRLFVWLPFKIAEVDSDSTYLELLVTYRLKVIR